ncbi:MAG: hypothetical protein MUD08_10835 [Cytophagales bacterium]|jgi:hypothetical protein|nr:hypothetical protein [Cytophagales bacterium]
MKTQTIDRDQLKSVVWELMQENPEFLKKLIGELIAEKETLQKETRDEKVTSMILDDLARYRKVWEALA